MNDTYNGSVGKRIRENCALKVMTPKGPMGPGKTTIQSRHRKGYFWSIASMRNTSSGRRKRRRRSGDIVQRCSQRSNCRSTSGTRLLSFAIFQSPMAIATVSSTASLLLGRWITWGRDSTALLANVSRSSRIRGEVTYRCCVLQQWLSFT